MYLIVVYIINAFHEYGVLSQIKTIIYSPFPEMIESDILFDIFNV